MLDAEPAGSKDTYYFFGDYYANDQLYVVKNLDPRLILQENWQPHFHLPVARLAGSPGSAPDDGDPS